MTAPAVPCDWAHWDRAVWPAACLESERLFRQPHARLFPLVALNRKDGRPQPEVMTVCGPGRLLSVFADEAQVALDAALHAAPRRRVTYLKPWEVWPVQAGTRCPGHGDLLFAGAAGEGAMTK
jgi:hypothetical protein